MTANRLAMSKALGAAFLNHQVEQLERKVTSGTARGRGGGWREERRYNSPRPGQGTNEHATDRSGNQRRGGASGAGATRAQKRPVSGSEPVHGQATDEKMHLSWRDEAKGDAHKDADIVVVDASVLIHGISYLKKWCRDGRQEVIIIPLEGTVRFSSLFLCLTGAILTIQRSIRWIC